VIALAPELIKIFAPDSYAEAVWIIPPVGLSIFFTFLYCFFADFEYYYEKTRFIMVASVFSAGLNILLNYIFIREFGYIAAGYTTLFCYIVYTFLHYLNYKYIINKILSRQSVYHENKILLICVVLIAFGFILASLYKYQVIRYSFVVLVFVFIYFRRNDLKSIFNMRKGSKYDRKESEEY